MDSGMVSKIEKARRYAQEKERVSFRQFEVVFKGDHNTYIVHYESGALQCGCRFFGRRGVCSHTMAMERILNSMLPQEQETDEPVEHSAMGEQL